MQNPRRTVADRFIPRRAGENFELSHFQLKAEKASLVTTNMLIDETKNAKNICHDEQKCINYAYRHYKQLLYRESLWNTVLPASRKILNFSNPHTRRPAKQNMKIPLEQHWPVKARKRPSIESPITILDMPNFPPYLCTHIVDWGKTGYIASIFNHNVFLVNPTESNMIVDCEIRKKIEYCVRWNRNGTRFAVSSVNGGIGIFDMERKKIIYKAKCMCTRPNCIVTCLEWAPDDKYLLSGCNNGHLVIWTSTLTLSAQIANAHDGIIITIAFSCMDNYFATSGVDGYVTIWQWPLLPHFKIQSSVATRCVAWHPWKDSLLVTGDKQATMLLWCVNNMKQLGSREGPNTASHLDSATFNRTSGELVTSYWINTKDDTTNMNGHCAISVFSNLETIVDCWQWHYGRVPYLLWGRDDSLLGTAGTDENLCIWKFLDRKNDSKLKKRISVDHIFGQCIR